MKKVLVFLLLIFVSVSYVYSEQKVNVDDWKQYQQYKKEQSNKISVSDKEYEEYKQYLQEKENVNKKQNSTEIKKSSSKVSENELNFKFGKILNNSSKIKLKNSYYGTSATTTDSNSEGWSIKMDYIHYLIENTGIGFGISYNSSFKSDDTSFLNFDILLKQRFPISSREKTYFYLSGGLGYGHLTGITKINYYNEYGDYQYYVKVNDGFQWMLSFGLDFTPFIIDLTYSCNYVGITTDLPSISGDMSWCSFILSVGYKFEL